MSVDCASVCMQRLADQLLLQLPTHLCPPAAAAAAAVQLEAALVHNVASAHGNLPRPLAEPHGQCQKRRPRFAGGCPFEPLSATECAVWTRALMTGKISFPWQGSRECCRW